ncbi:MAG: PD40 domain-containing protein, partial [Planctomycetales bacterium]|nr:PD40 domain-containing protein [Planctomycetales bacterium]
SQDSRYVTRAALSRSESRVPRVLAWSPDSRRLALPADDYAVQILDVDAGKVMRTLRSGGGRLLSLAWSPDGKFVASGGVDGVLRLWDPESGSEIQQMGDLSRNQKINAIAWRPDGAQLAFATSESGVVLWRPQETSWRYLPGHTTYVLSVHWSPDGRRIVSTDESGSVRIWDPDAEQMTLALQFGPETSTFGRGWLPGVSDAAWSPDGKTLAGAGWSGEQAVRFWTTQVEPTPTRLW